MQNSDNTLNLKQALLELLKVVKKNHYTKDENDSKLSLKVDDIIYQVDKNNLESEIKNLELSDEQIIGIINNEIKALIPNQATNENQLADKDFVNSSISTATATFRGTYTNKDSFPNNVDANDYVFYDTTDEIGNRKFDKYKYSNGEWVYEYTLNNSSFTEEQWKAINSGATIELINKILTNEENINNLNNNKLEKETFNSFKLENNEALNTKVDKIEGKGLSTNDFTNELKEKLNGIEANAQVNTITGVKGDNEADYRVGNVSISKENIGLGNVDNTSDKEKPISDATQEALDLKADKKDVSEVDIDVEGTSEIVSIPENATGYGTIKKLGGKSYKSENLCASSSMGFIDSSSGNIGNADNSWVSNKIKVYANHTYTYIGYSYGIYNLDGTWNSLAVYRSSNQIETFTPNSDCYVVIQRRIDENIMLNEGSEALPYEPYFEGIKTEYPTNVKVVGRNLWDEEWESGSYSTEDGSKITSNQVRSKNYISVKPSSKYYCVIPNSQFIRNFYYDIYKNFISSDARQNSGILTTPSNCYYMTFVMGADYGATYKNDIAIIKGTSGTYTPYTEQNFPQTNAIDYVSNQLQTKYNWSSEFASKWLGLGVGNDSNNIANANKKGNVKYGIIDLGTLNWTQHGTYEQLFTATFSGIKNYGELVNANILCAKYRTSAYGSLENYQGVIGYNGTDIRISDNTYTNATDFKNAMQGVMLIYELAEPIEIDLSSLDIEAHFECESNGSIIHDNLANYKYSFPVSLKGQVALNFEHDKEQQRDIDSLKKEIDELDNNKANKSELSNVAKGLDKTLYNLGSFDTISGNVITRQTGYLVINAEDIISTSIETSGGGDVKFVKTKYNGLPVDMNITSGGTCGVSSNGYGVIRVNFYWIGNTQICLNNTGTQSDDYVCISNNSFTTIDEFKALCPISIQYKLATSYTEEIIEGQPLITLDQQGSQWLRSEWEKGLNLVDNTIYGGQKLACYGYFNGTDINASEGTIYWFDTNLVANKNYTLSAMLKIGNFEATAIYVLEYEDNTYVQGYFASPLQSTYTFTIARITPSKNVKRFFIGIYSYGSYVSVDTSTIMLNEGTEPLPYQEYNGSIVREKQIEELKNEINSLKERIALLESK